MSPTRTRATVRLPGDCPLPGRRIQVLVHHDLRTPTGNVIVPSGCYEAVAHRDGPPGTVVVWSAEHYSGHACYATVPLQGWTFLGEAPPSAPGPVPGVSFGSLGPSHGLYCADCRDGQ